MKTEIAFCSLTEELRFDLTRKTKKTTSMIEAIEIKATLVAGSGHFLQTDDPDALE